MHLSLRTAFLGFFLASLGWAQNLADIEKRVTEFTLSNGLHFIVFERHEAPVVSFHTFVNAGSVDDPKGRTGLAHMFEHMAFKGTPEIGTTNYEEEKKALEEIERIYDRLEQEQRKHFRADKARIADLEGELRKAIEKANSYVEPNAFPRIIEENGGVGLNAGTAMDYTVYFYSLPSNRIELWFLLESERFKNVVFREFYKERDVVREERRMRTESSPQGKLIEAALSTAFAAHPYKISGVGWASDIENFRVPDAKEFFETYYVPANLTIAIAGDVQPSEAKRLAEKYFGPMPAGPLPPLVRTEEPEQPGEKRVEVESAAQPFLLLAYKRPDQYSPDDPVLDVLASLFSSGRTGTLYKELVSDRKIALAAQAYPGFPGSKYPSLFLFFLVPNQGHTVEELEKATYEIIERLRSQPVEQAALDRVKIKLRASLIRQLASNSGMAGQLASYHANYGDWRKLFTGLDEINKVTAEDVQRVARTYFIDRSKTVAYTAKPETAEEEGSR